MGIANYDNCLIRGVQRGRERAQRPTVRTDLDELLLDRALSSPLRERERVMVRDVELTNNDLGE